MNNDIESHSEMKLLGVNIDEHLNFSSHIGEVCENASRKVGVLIRLRNMLTTSAKLKILIFVHNASKYMLSYSVAFLSGVG